MNENEIKAIANTFIRIAAELSDLADRLHRLADGKMKKMDSEQICQQKHGIQGYQAVDLGLPSGLKWSDRNVGAEKPEAFGDYFAWGETAPRGEKWDTEAPYDWAHAPFNNGIGGYDDEYFNEHKSEWLTDECILKSEYDAAHVNMGGSWRMPTSAEMQELIDGTNREIGMVEGVKGMFFISKKDSEKKIFMPFAGYRYGSETDIFCVDYCGFAWSSSLRAGNADDSHCICFGNNGKSGVGSSYRRNGIVVRGVHK